MNPEKISEVQEPKIYAEFAAISMGLEGINREIDLLTSKLSPITFVNLTVGEEAKEISPDSPPQSEVMGRLSRINRDLDKIANQLCKLRDAIDI